MKPNPFWALNHFTVPIVIFILRVIREFAAAHSERWGHTPHRTESGPGLNRAWEGRPNHEDVEKDQLGHPPRALQAPVPAGRSRPPGAPSRPSDLRRCHNILTTIF